MFLIYKSKIGPVSKDNSQIEFVVKEGDTYYSLSNELYNKKLIKSQTWFKIYIKFYNIDKLNKGYYSLSKDMGVKKIVDILSGKIVLNNDISIVFQEGLNVRQIGLILEKNTNIKQEEFINTMQDKNYLSQLIDKYWFLTNDILNDKIYYPLEGYLYPDTYKFSINTTSKDVIEKMLDNFNNKIKSFEKEINNTNYSMHQIITMSSIIELEAGNAKDRAKVSKVFYNRMNIKGETLGSDITAYYGAKMDDWSNGLGKAETECNGYNTRLNSKCPINGLPVGPVCNPSVESIRASIYPDQTVGNDYLFFVADCSGRTYLTKTYSEHNSIIQNLKNMDNWCDN